MKKFLVILLMLAIATSMVFAGGNKNQTAAGSELIKIGVVTAPASESGYRAAHVKEMNDVFSRANGYDASILTYATHNEQIDAARQLINSGVKYLIIAAQNSNGWDAVLADAKRAGIHVFVADRFINTAEENFTAAVVSDMLFEGRTVVSWIEAQNRAGGNKFVHIQGAMGSDAQIGRTTPLNDGIARNADWSLVRRGTGGDSWSADEAKRIVQAAIAAREDFNIIYAENTGMAEGAMKALQEAGISHGQNGDVWIVAFDFDKFGLRYVQNGSWNALMQCSPLQASIIDGYIRTLESGRPLQLSVSGWQYGGKTYNNVHISREIIVDNKTVTQAIIDQLGLGD